MSGIPTESRIFADRYCREVRRLEQLHAGRLVPGATTWRSALETLVERMNKLDSPTKGAKLFGRAIDYLCNVVPPEHRIYAVFVRSQASRSAGVVFATLEAGNHPLNGVPEQGVEVQLHQIRCNRAGMIDGAAAVPLAFASKHMIARLHERSHGLTPPFTTSLILFAGTLGLLVRHSEDHIGSGLSLKFEDTLLVGSLRHALQESTTGGKLIVSGFFDVRSAVPIDITTDRKLLKQGTIATEVVTEWLTRPAPDPSALAARIPFLAGRRDDFVARTAAVRS